MKSLWPIAVALIALGLQACSLTGGSGSPEGTRGFLKSEMDRHGIAAP